MYLQFHSAKEPSKNRDIWVRVMVGSLRGSVRFGSVLGKTWVLVGSFLLGSGSFPSLTTVDCTSVPVSEMTYTVSTLNSTIPIPVRV